MLRESQIIDLVYKVPFPGITADTLIFIVRKGPPSLDVSARVSEYGKAPIKRPQREFLEHPSSAFEYFEDAASQKLINKLGNMNFFRPLNLLCQSTSGYGGKSNLITEERQTKRQIPTLKGDSIGRYEQRKAYWFEFKKENITGRTTDITKLGAKPKILMRKTGDQIIATFDDSGVYPEQSLYFLYSFQPELNPKFILGILNSRLMSFYYRARALTNKKSIAQVKKVDLDILPFPPVDSSANEGRAIHDRMVRLVDQVLETKHHLTVVLTDHDKTYYQSKCDSLERQIDLLVYRLYKITDKDIEQIESPSSE